MPQTPSSSLSSSLPSRSSLPAPPGAWSIILAGGEGTRLRGYLARQFGETRPKQYCAFSGTRTMLQHAVDRGALLAGAGRTLTVVAEPHLRWARPQLADRGGVVIAEPTRRDTAAGLFLALAWLRAREPGALVYVLPADHFVDPERRFLEVVASAGAIARCERQRLVLIGAVPDAIETEYGYIEPRVRTAAGVAVVARFVEKPDRAAAIGAIARGALWNTMVMAGTVDAFWAAGQAALPAMMVCFERLVDAFDTAAERPVLDGIYRRMAPADVARDVLTPEASRCLVLPLAGVEWSDWGHPDRIERSVERLARTRRARAATGPDRTARP